uniref:Uncharacterized protein n=1 Tax=Caenorhabditis japonica TaxID=281687 RepID=A0A8R1EC14_CAEJA
MHSETFHAQEQMKQLQKLEEKYSRIHLSQIIDKISADDDQKIVSREAELMTKERLCCGLNVFENFLLRIKQMLGSDEIWTGKYPTNGVFWIDECVEWYRVYSALQFFLCQPLRDDNDVYADKMDHALPTYRIHHPVGMDHNFTVS